VKKKRKAETNILTKQCDLASFYLKLRQDQVVEEYEAKYGKGLFDDHKSRKAEEEERDTLKREIKELDRLILLAKNTKDKRIAIEKGKLKETEHTRRLENTFVWKLDFAEVFKEKGGFDIVVENPPYINSKELKQKEQYCNYTTATNQFDLFILFIERSILLLHEMGVNSLIIPDSFLARSSFENSRRFLFTNCSVYRIIHLNKVFEEANVSSSVYIATKFSRPSNQTFIYEKAINAEDWIRGKVSRYNLKIDIKNDRNLRVLPIGREEKKLIEKLTSNPKLADYAFLWRGEELGKNSSKALRKASARTCELLVGENIQRYYVAGRSFYIDKSEVAKELDNYKKEKILIRQLGDKINAALDQKGRITIQSVYNLIIIEPNLDSKVLLGILNSSSIGFLYDLLFAEKLEFPRILLENLRQLPIPEKSVKAPDTHKRLISLVDKIINTKQSDNSSDTRKLEYEIDQVVYALYELTEKDIALIEGRD